jgi:hypothetical protein
LNTDSFTDSQWFKPEFSDLKSYRSQEAKRSLSVITSSAARGEDGVGNETPNGQWLLQLEQLQRF